MGHTMVSAKKALSAIKKKFYCTLTPLSPVVAGGWGVATNDWCSTVRGLSGRWASSYLL